MTTPYRLTTLPNGARIASIELPHMQSASVGLWTSVGGRNESKSLGGIAHFTEHLLFKGTAKRNAKKITESVEGIGGYLNAFTTEDHTCYYAKAAATHFPTLCEVLGDMYLNSQFAPVEIEREREVIREEILMVHDNPSQHVQELLSETLWPDHPIGRPLTGTVESISRFTREDFLDFTRKHYTGRSTIAAVAGRVSHECVVDTFAPILNELPAGRAVKVVPAKPVIPGSAPRINVSRQEIEQTHLAMGYHSFGRHDERRYALKLLSVILGENMSSRLFQKLRERYGFCYSVQSCLVSLDDAGALTVTAALDHSKLEKAIKLILSEVERLQTKAPSRSELQKAKDYTIGQTLMGLESTTNQMMWIGESIIGYGQVCDPVAVEKKLLAVTPEEICAVAKEFLNRDRLAVVVSGADPSRERIQRSLA